MNQRRVVVTGVGAVTPYGIGAETLIDRWIDGELAVSDGTGTCDDFDPADFLEADQIENYDRFCQFAVVAADEALAMAGWKDDGLPIDAERIGCVIGTGSGGQWTLVEGTRDYLESGPTAVPSYLIPKAMNNAAASVVSMRYGLRGPAQAVASACSSGSDAIADAMRMLRSGQTDAMVVGGAEAGLHELTISAFRNMEALSDDGIPRPFDARRDGFVMGEGAGVLVLEDAEAAERRGANIVGELLGYAATNDAYHIVAPHPEARGAIKAIERALANAGIEADDVDYVNAHGTATPANDRSETIAIQHVLGDRATSIPVSSLKSAIGHLIGGAGAVESIATLLALRRRIAPPTLNWEEREEGMDLDYVPQTARPMFRDGQDRAPEDKAIAVSNSFGFGGHNSVLVFAATANGTHG